MSSERLFDVPVGWDWTTLGEICARGGGDIQTGPFGSQLHASDYSAEGTPVVMPQDLDDGRISEAAIARVSLAHVQRLARHQLDEGDIVYSRRGDVTRRARVGRREVGWLCGTGCLRVRLGKGADSSYVVRALGHPAVSGWIQRHAIGATMANLNTAILAAVPVPLPPLDEQRRVVQVLASIDDKIESNQALAHLLHAIAEQAYRRALGASRPALLGELGTIRGGGTPKSSVPAYWEPADVAWITVKDMTALAGSPVIWRGERNISQLGLQKSSAKLLPAGTVLYTSRATLGMIAIAQQELSTNEGFITIEPAPGLSSELVYFTLRANRDAIAARANGSTFLNVNKTNFKAVECRIPDEGARAAFQAVAGPAFRLIAGLTQESQRLREVRDTLLPKLVSGQIRVPAGVEPRGEAQAADLVESTA